MQQLHRRYPARAADPSWQATRQDGGLLLARMLELPFTGKDQRVRRRWGLVSVIEWLAAHPGQTWQERWQATGADTLGNAEWWRPSLDRLQAGSMRHGSSVSVTSNLRVSLNLLVCADAIRPSLHWLLTPFAPHHLATDMARVRDQEGFAELAARCSASGAGATTAKSIMRRAATIVAAKGGLISDITVGDCLELEELQGAGMRRTNRGAGLYDALHSMGVFGADAPSTLRAFATQGQLSPEQMLQRFGIEYEPVRHLLNDYLLERAPSLDHTTLRGLAATLGRLFWRDLEIHHPGISSLNLAPDVAAAWKQRILLKITRATGPDGQVIETRDLRSNGRAELGQVRAFYLDIAQWAMEEPARWGPWAAPSPVRREDLARMKEIRLRKSRMDQRTRERLPALPALVAASRPRPASAPNGSPPPWRPVPARNSPATARCCTGPRPVPGPPPRPERNPVTRTRRDLTGEEDRAFWTWAAIETLRHTGIRIEELCELSHHSLIQYTPPASTELIPLLQIAPSKTDTERLLVISPELADVLASVINRIREPAGAVACVAAYDSHERVWNPPMPLLFQRRIGGVNRSIPPDTIREWICRAVPAAGLTDQLGRTAAEIHSARFPADLHHRRRPARNATPHRPARRRPPRHQHHDGLQGRLPRGSHQRPPRIHRPPPGTAPGRGIPDPYRRRMAGISRPLRAPQGLPRHLRPLLRHRLHPRALLPALPPAAPRPSPTPAPPRCPRQPAGPDRRSPPRRMARRSRRPPDQPRRSPHQTRPGRADGQHRT